MKRSCESDKGPSHRWCCSEIVPADPVRQSPPDGMEFLANRENCPSGRTAASMSDKVKLTRTHYEQMFSAVLLRADIAQCSRHVRFTIPEVGDIIRSPRRHARAAMMELLIRVLWRS